MKSMNINKQLGNYFLSDSSDYLNRYNELKGRSTYVGNRSKLLIDLIFSIECLLKANIFYESSLTEKETYSKIRTHCIEKLTKKLSNKSKAQFDSCIKEDLSKYQVDIRYQLESEIYFRNDEGVLDKKYYDSIANPSWLEKVSLEIRCYSEYVKSLNPVKLKTIKFSNINLDEEGIKNKILNDLRKK